MCEGPAGVRDRRSVPARRPAPCARLLAGLLVAVAVAACAGPPVAASPEPATGIFQQLLVHGGATISLVSGDPGCNDSKLAPFAIHATVRIPASAPESDVYLFTYADHAAYEREKAAFEQCRAQYASGPGAGRQVPEIEVSPYRAFGPGWSAQFRATLQQAMEEAAGSGG